MENIKEVLPKRGLVYQESNPQLVLCKPKLLPLKSVTLEKLEKMQKDANEKAKAMQEEIEKEKEQMAYIKTISHNLGVVGNLESR